MPATNDSPLLKLKQTGTLPVWDKNDEKRLGPLPTCVCLPDPIKQRRAVKGRTRRSHNWLRHQPAQKQGHRNTVNTSRPGIATMVR